MLLAIDLMAFNAIDSQNEGLYMFGWLVLFFSAILYGILIIQTLSKRKAKNGK